MFGVANLKRRIWLAPTAPRRMAAQPLTVQLRVVFNLLEQRCQFCLDLVKMLQRPLARRNEGLGGLCLSMIIASGLIQINMPDRCRVPTQHTQLMLAIPDLTSYPVRFRGRTITAVCWYDGLGDLHEAAKCATQDQFSYGCARGGQWRCFRLAAVCLGESAAAGVGVS